MATEKQIAANRANAKRSTGPVTEKGKQASSQNALRHGQLSSSVVLKAESPTLFDELLSALTEEFQPQTANETALVETMAVARWRPERKMEVCLQCHLETSNEKLPHAIVRFDRGAA